MCVCCVCVLCVMVSTRLQFGSWKRMQLSMKQFPMSHSPQSTSSLSLQQNQVHIKRNVHRAPQSTTEHHRAPQSIGKGIERNGDQ